MKTMLFLLLALLIGFNSSAQSPPRSAKPKVKTIFNSRLLDLATKELPVQRLRKIYGSALPISKVSRNIHEPGVKDTILTADVGADHLRIFSNKYNSFLLSAEFTSRKLKFGKGVQVGVNKATFCKAFGLPPTVDGYQLAEVEGGSSIYFLFRQGMLTSVSYDVGWID